MIIFGSGLDFLGSASGSDPGQDLSQDPDPVPYMGQNKHFEHVKKLVIDVNQKCSTLRDCRSVFANFYCDEIFNYWQIAILST